MFFNCYEFDVFAEYRVVGFMHPVRRFDCALFQDFSNFLSSMLAGFVDLVAVSAEPRK
jgi:hypothetical protein